MYEFSSSMIDAFSVCPMRGQYAYLDGGNGIVPDRMPDALAFGRIWHAGLEAYYLAHDPYEAMALEKKQQVGAMAQVWEEDEMGFAVMGDLAEGMMANYIKWDSAQIPLGKVLKVEHEFRARVYKPNGKRAVAAFRGKLDLAVEDENGLVFLWDHKSMASFDSDFEASNHLNRQFRRYAWAWQQETGLEVSGFGVNAARKKLPTVPKVLAKGGLSQDKRIDTTSDVYFNAIMENGLDPADYADFLETLPGLDSFFRRDLIYFNQDEIAEAGEELYWILRRMTTKNPAVKMPSPLCSKLRPCPYRVLCIEDTEEMRMMYRSKERRLEELS